MNPKTFFEPKTYQVKYITGHTILSNRPAQFEFYGQNVKVVLDAHKDEPASVLFDVPVSTVGKYKSIQMGGGAGANTSATYIVNGKKYSFLSNDGSFMGDLEAVDGALGTGGAHLPQTTTNSRAQTIVILIVVIGVAACIAFAILSK